MRTVIPDFQNLIAASVMLWHHIIPYGKAAFFAAPWTMFIFLPFNFSFGLAFWQACSILAVVVCAMLANPTNRWFPLLMIFMPPTIFLVSEGQDSALVALACTVLLIEVAGKCRPWVILICLFVASAKVSIAAFPAVVALVILVYKKQYKSLMFIAILFGGLDIIFEMIYPGITMQWILAMKTGNVVENGWPPYLVLLSLPNGWIIPMGLNYYSAAPWFISLPILAAFAWLMRKGLTRGNIALALSIGFLFLPYWRIYDLVMLSYPVGVLIDFVPQTWNRARLSLKSRRVVKP